jgi:UDP-glucose 4-epimerase
VQVDHERVRPDASEVERLQCDPAKARQLLGWAPTITLEQGLRLTAEYLAGHLDDTAADRYVV